MNPDVLPLARDTVFRRNNVVVQGRDRGKPAVVFVNGFGGEQTMWRSIAPHFASSRRVVLFDHVGTGRSQRSAFVQGRYSSLDGYADDLLQVCDAADAQDAVLVAHSVGGIIGILAANRWPCAFRELILIGASPCFRNDGSYLGGFERADLDDLFAAMETDYPHWTRQVSRLFMGHSKRPELALELESSFNRIDPAVARQLARVSFDSDHREDLACLGTPTTILQSADDHIVPDLVAEFMQETIPRCELLRLETTGHCPQLSAPEEITHVLRGLLDERWSETEAAEMDTAF